MGLFALRWLVALVRRMELFRFAIYLAALVFVGSALGTAAVIAAIVVAVVWVAVVSVVVSAMSAVFQTALYLYATTGEICHTLRRVWGEYQPPVIV